MIYYLYILKSKMIEKLYIGISQDPQKRLSYHNTIEKGFTSRYRPWEIVYLKEFSNKQEALVTERKLKGWKNKRMIEKVIKGEIDL